MTRISKTLFIFSNIKKRNPFFLKSEDARKRFLPSCHHIRHRWYLILSRTDSICTSIHWTPPLRLWLFDGVTRATSTQQFDSGLMRYTRATVLRILCHSTSRGEYVDEIINMQYQMKISYIFPLIYRRLYFRLFKRNYYYFENNL